MRRTPTPVTAPAALSQRRGGSMDVHRAALPPGEPDLSEVASGGQVREPWIDTSIAHNPWWQRDGIDRRNSGEHVAVYYDPMAEEYEPLVFAQPNVALIPRDPPDTWSAPLWETQPAAADSPAADED